MVGSFIPFPKRARKLPQRTIHERLSPTVMPTGLRLRSALRASARKLVAAAFCSRAMWIRGGTGGEDVGITPLKCGEHRPDRRLSSCLVSLCGVHLSSYPFAGYRKTLPYPR